MELRGAFALATIYLMRMLGLFMIMPVIAVLAIDYPDYSPFWLGLAIGGYGLTQAILQIPMGIWSDKIGRKPVITIGLILFALGSFVAATAESMLWVTVGRVMQGAGAIAGAVMALAADVSRESQRSKVMAIIGIAIGFSFYLALILGPVLATNWGLQGIFLATGFLAIFCIPLVWLMVPKVTAFAPSGDTLPNLLQLRQLLFDKPLIRLYLSVLFLHMMITVMFVQLPVRLLDLDWGIDTHWQLYLPVLVSSILGMGLLMSLARKTNMSSLLMAAVIMLGAAFVLIPLVPVDLISLLICVWLFFTAFNFLEANFPALVSSLAPPGRKGTAMGIFASFQFFGAFLGGVLSSLVSQWLTNDWLFFVAAMICFSWCLIFLGFKNTDKGKRYTLSVNFAGRDLSTLENQFKQLGGIHEFVIFPDQQAVYLKVDGKDFDLKAARKLADPS